MVGVIDGFRWCVLGGQSELYTPGLATSIGVTALFSVVRHPSNLSLDCATCRMPSSPLKICRRATCSATEPANRGSTATRRHRARGPQLYAQSNRRVPRTPGRLRRRVRGVLSAQE